MESFEKYVDRLEEALIQVSNPTINQVVTAW